MSEFSENYHLRKFYLESETVPTQSVMKERMSPSLAQVYFKSMSPKLKVLAGLEPPMKGGGSDWYVPPKELLDGRAVLKPIKRQFITKLGFNGIDFFGEKIVKEHHRQMEEEKRKTLFENDINWKRVIEANCRQQWEDTSKQESKQNTIKIQQAFQEFTTIYMTSMTKIEALLSDAATKEIERVKKEAFDKMTSHYETLLKQQATMLYDRYADKLLKEKTKLKEQFILDVENSRTEMGNQIHDINLEKHVAIEKLRVVLECQNLACQVYVALKEREECKKDMDLSKHEHEKAMKVLSEKIKMQDFEIKLEKEKEIKRLEFIQVWQKKICHVVKRFQEFVTYCLNTLPEYAEFFINMEKLMLLQLSEAIENPSVQSIFVPEEDTFHTPIPKPHPFYLFCDKGFKPKIEENLCPKHCTSSASQLPVIIVNKKCIYSACDNFEMFAEKLKQFLDGSRGIDEDFVDDHDYTYDIPIKPTTSVDLKQVKLQSSLMQLLQNEFPNPRQVEIECCVCKIPTCYCGSSPKTVTGLSKEVSDEFIQFKVSGQKIESRSVELEHEREPKWESYIDYVLPKKCFCSKRVKKHLEEHLPAYMRNVSAYGAPELPFYETCKLDSLKKLVKKSQGKDSPLPEVISSVSKTRDVSTQYLNQEYEYLCTCFSDDEVDKLFENLMKGSKLYENIDRPKSKNVDASISPSHLHTSPQSFAHDRARSLRRLLEDAPELEEIFKKDDCQFFL